MKRKVLALLLSLCMLLTWMPTAFAVEGDVEISFRVGDSTLIINGAPVTVETPYVVDPGVTLVPLRVITEAFGATVNWIAETKSIPITYEGVSILLQIDNPIAEVNGKAEELLCAPQLTENGFTMVPLRFISETFGAEVGYDEETRAITVVKKRGASGQTVVGTIDEARIGDSYYGWSMENPKDMYMDERTFDGLLTSFAYDDQNGFEITIDSQKDFDFDSFYNSTRNALNNFTLVKADKKTENGVKSAHLQARSSTRFYNVHIFANDRYQMTLLGIFSTEDEAKRVEFVRLTDTIEMRFTNDDTYDLSNVQNGWRTYRSDEMKLSLVIPQDFYQSTSEDVTPNSLHFYNMDSDDPISYVYYSVYSKSSVGSAKEMAEFDYGIQKKMRNRDIVSLTAPAEKTYQGGSVWEYTMTVTKSPNEASLWRDVFFEVGEYVYNVTVRLKSSIKNADSMMNTIYNSIQTEELSPEKVGMLLRNEIDLNSSLTSKSSTWSIEIPQYFIADSVNSSGGMYLDPLSETVIFFSIDSANGTTQSDLQRILQNYQREKVKSDEFTTVVGAKEISVGGKRFATSITEGIDEENDKYYLVEYITVQKNKVYYFVIDVPELSYSDYVLKVLEGIVGSLTVN